MFFTIVISGQDDDLVVEESIDETNEPTCDGQFEVYNACGSATDPSCESQSRRIRVTNSRCFSRCFCIDGYVRNSTNSCVPLSQCPVRSCLDTEDYSECGPSCDITCENYLVKDVSFELKYSKQIKIKIFFRKYWLDVIYLVMQDAFASLD